MSRAEVIKGVLYAVQFWAAKNKTKSEKDRPLILQTRESESQKGKSTGKSNGMFNSLLFVSSSSFPRESVQYFVSLQLKTTRSQHLDLSICKEDEQDTQQTHNDKG